MMVTWFCFPVNFCDIDFNNDKAFWAKRRFGMIQGGVSLDVGGEDYEFSVGQLIYRSSSSSLNFLSFCRRSWCL